VPKKCWSHSDIYVQKPHSVRPWRHWFELTNCGPGSEATSSWTHNLAHRSPVSGCHPYISLCIPTVFRYAMPLGMFHLFKAAIASLWRILVTKTSLGINSKNSMLAGCFFKWLHCLKYWTTQVPNFYHKSWQLWLDDFPKDLINISQSTLNWPFVSCASPTCWRIWTSTVCTLYTGLAKGTWLTQPMGPWLETYNQTWFWNWRLLNPTHLVYWNTPAAPACVALPTLTRRMFIKISLMVPMELPFEGPPVTPIYNVGQICLPFPTIAMAPNTITEVLTPYKTLQQQFHSLIPPWKHALFGSPWKAYLTKTLHKQLAANILMMIVSNALVQNNGQSGFAWVIAQEITTLWWGLGLAPGPAADVYSGRAEAFGLFWHLVLFSTTFPATLCCNKNNKSHVFVTTQVLSLQ